MPTTEKIDKLLAPTVEALGFEWVGCEFKQGHGRALLRIYIDRANGVTIDECAKVSRQLSAVLDVENLLTGGFVLEVSSPGLERPLFSLSHYQQFLGCEVRFRLRIPYEEQRNFKAIIKAVTGEQIEFQEEKRLLRFKIGEIEKATLMLSIEKK